MDTSTNEPTIQEVRSWEAPTLLQWIQKALAVPLKPVNAQKFLNAEIDGEAFLGVAGREEFFQKLGISPGPSVRLAQLAKKIIDAESAKGRFYFINTLPCCQPLAHVLPFPSYSEAMKQDFILSISFLSFLSFAHVLLPCSEAMKPTKIVPSVFPFFRSCAD